MPDLPSAPEPGTVAGHEIVPQPGTCYSAGPRNAGMPADLRSELHFPVEAVCRACGCRVVRDRMLPAEWRHEAR